MPDMQFIDSKSIEAIGYDPESQELHVRFLQSGKTYVYYGVEQWVFDEFMGAESKGIYFNMNIKGAFNYGEI